MSLFFLFYSQEAVKFLSRVCFSVKGGEQLANGFSIIAWEYKNWGRAWGRNMKRSSPAPPSLVLSFFWILIQQKVLWSATTAVLQNLVLLYLCHWLILLSPNVPRKPSYMLGFHCPGPYGDACQALNRRSVVCRSGVNNLYCGDPFS